MQKNEQITGLGDVIAKLTSLFGIKPCEGCKRRQATLNRLVSFGYKLSEDDKSIFARTIADIKGSRITPQQQQNINILHNRVFKQNVEPTNCMECLRQRIADLAEVLT